MAVVVEEYSDKSVLVLAPTDELLTAKVIHEIQTHCESNRSNHVVINFKFVHSLVSGSLYPDAAPFEPLIKLHKQFQQDGRQLVLCCLNIEIADVFRVTRLERIFKIQPELDTVLSSIEEEE